MSNSAPVTIGGSIGELQFTAAEREALVRHGDEGDENIVRRDVQSVNHQPANGCSDAPLVLQGPVRSEEDRDDHGVLTTLHVHESGMKVKPIRIMLGNDDETAPRECQDLQPGKDSRRQPKHVSAPGRSDRPGCGR